MGRYRSRSRSYSPKRGKRYDDPRDSRSRRDRRSPAPTGLLVRNISLDAREPRGFGFVKFRHPEDAAEAKEHLDRTVIGGREIRIVFAEENRKTPHEMRRTTHTRLEEEAIGGKVQRGLQDAAIALKKEYRACSWPKKESSSKMGTGRGTAGQGMTITLHADPYLPRDQFHLMMRETIGQIRSPQGILGPFPGLFLHGVGEITGLATGPQAQGGMVRVSVMRGTMKQEGH
ncbi:SC35-like splicing factor 28 [Actinidia rufa]|uniref:SC35-like splicing factor 28 n=1 Tax=Actinidia rufa TaxID=165716 RepID=A0A7J0EFR4_9ERIC|nr:SC35-like splicing factor 28 [Actinidia rufa]